MYVSFHKDGCDLKSTKKKPEDGCGKTGKLGNAIMLIRNPYDAILSNYNRNMGNIHAGGKHSTKSHVGKATMDDFVNDWAKHTHGARDRYILKRNQFLSSMH